MNRNTRPGWYYDTVRCVESVEANVIKKLLKGGECNAVDNLCDPDSAVVVRYGYVLYDGRSDSYSARNCCYNGAGKRYSRAEARLELS